MSLEYNIMAISTKDNNTLKKESSLGNMLKGTRLFIGYLYCDLYSYIICNMSLTK